MLRRYHLSLPAVLLSLSVPAVADIILTNGADLNMNGSTGSTVIFPDGTVLSTASGTGAEMLYDAIYLSIYNLAYAPPYDTSIFTWDNLWNSVEIFSVPEADQFVVNWRPNAHHVIILFTDEPGDSFLIPEITVPILQDMITNSSDLKTYFFTSPSFNIKSSWEP